MQSNSNVRRPSSSRTTGSNTNISNINDAITGYRSNTNTSKMNSSQYRNHLKGYAKRKQIEMAARSMHGNKANDIRETYGLNVYRSALTKAFRDSITTKHFVLKFPFAGKNIDHARIERLTGLLQRGADPTGPMLSYLFRSRNMKFIELVIKSFLKYHDINARFNTDFSGSSVRSGHDRRLSFPTTLLDCAVRHVNPQAVKLLLELGANPNASKRGHALNNLLVSDPGSQDMVETLASSYTASNVTADNIVELLLLFRRRGVAVTDEYGNNALDRILERRGYVLDKVTVHYLDKNNMDLSIRVMRDLRLFPARPMPISRAITPADVPAGISWRIKKELFSEFVVRILAGKPRPKSLLGGALKSLYRVYNLQATVNSIRLRTSSLAAHLEYFRILLDAGADPNERDEDGNTILHTIAGSDLLEQSLSFRRRNETEYLDKAHKQLFATLIDEYSANPFIKNRQGQTALDLLEITVLEKNLAGKRGPMLNTVRESRTYKYLADSTDRIQRRAAKRNVLNAHGVNRNMQQEVLKKAKLTNMSSTHPESGLRAVSTRLGLTPNQNKGKSKRQRQIDFDRTVSTLQRMGKL